MVPKYFYLCTINLILSNYSNLNKTIDIFMVSCNAALNDEIPSLFIKEVLYCGKMIIFAPYEKKLNHDNSKWQGVFKQSEEVL